MTASQDPVERVRDAFRERFARPPEMLVRAPGRVALLGAHVDYSDGWVMPAAIERAVYLAASPADGGRSTLLALDEGEECTLDAHALAPPRPVRGGDLHWSDLPAGLAWAFADAGFTREGELPALDVVYGGDLPAGAGVSSSAAVAVGFALAWRRVGGLEPVSTRGGDTASRERAGTSPAPTPESADGAHRDGAHRVLSDLELTRLCRRMENGYLGVQSGIMDPFASLFGRAGQAIFLDCRTLESRHVPVSGEAAVIVFDSGVRRRLAQSGFNDRREECRQAVATLGEHLPDLRALRDVTAEDFERHSHHLPHRLRLRARHAIEEMQRVRDGAEALDRGDLEVFGALMRRSHLSSRDFYEVSIPELDLLAAAAWPLDGCWGARMMGGGFGGCVAALVEIARAAEITDRVSETFEAHYGRRPPAFVSPLAAGAGFLV